MHRVETAPEGAPVRHVDQLSERDAEALFELTRGRSVPAPGLVPGEVVVFTSYYRVVEVESATPAGTVEPSAGADREVAPDGDGRSPVRR